jgi:hypothetical protein
MSSLLACLDVRFIENGDIGRLAVRTYSNQGSEAITEYDRMLKSTST